MIQENQSERMTSNFIEVNGIGTIETTKGFCDVFVYGYFQKWDRWFFIVHQDIENPKYITVSEASTGRRLQNENYYTVEDALYFAVPFIEKMKHYFATSVGNILVKTKTDLLNRNTTNTQTLAISSLLWM